MRPARTVGGMRRRAFLLATAGTPVLAGCTRLEPPTQEIPPEHPFADRTVSVLVRSNTDSPHDVDAIAADALDFWATHARTYAGFRVNFRIVDADPDLTIGFVDSPGVCAGVPGNDARVLGCAPLLTAGRRVPDDLTAWVVAADRPIGKIRTTTKHEIGHVLGLDHEDEPRDVMSNRPEDRIPAYHIRLLVWEGVLESNEAVSRGAVLFGFGSDRWHDGDYGAAVAAFADAARAYGEADASLVLAVSRVDGLDRQPTVETVAFDDLRAALADLTTAVDLHREIADGLSAAAHAMDAGNERIAADRLSTVNEAIVAFEDLEPVAIRDVAVALGLVRGFDRDDPIVEPPDEEYEA